MSFASRSIPLISDVFCKIIKGELPAEVIYKDDDFLVIKDINPQAPVHLLIIPVKHYDSLEDFMDPVRSRARPPLAGESRRDRGAATSNGMEGSDTELLGRALVITHKVAHQTGISDQGYRLILNEGEYGGKLVPHLHIHLLGGKRLGPKLIK